MKNADKYSDIINLPHHQSATRPRMSNYDRAAQFSPFAALKGYDEEIEEAQRITEGKRELTDEQIAELNEKLVLLKSKEKEHPIIKVVFFVRDEKRKGGIYSTIEDKLNRVDVENKMLILNQFNIFFNDIRWIEHY